jgi:hypothetical protein
MALRSTVDFETFCTQQVDLRGGVDRVHKHAMVGVSWRGRGRQPIRQAATSTAISASVFQHERPKPTSTASPTSTSRDGFGTNFCYRNQMRDSDNKNAKHVPGRNHAFDSAQGHVLLIVEAFLSRLATYKPTHRRSSAAPAPGSAVGSHPLPTAHRPPLPLPRPRTPPIAGSVWPPPSTVPYVNPGPHGDPPTTTFPPVVQLLHSPCCANNPTKA